ncbi:Histidine phosphatase superfamily (branch 1) [Planctomycetes bacterium Pla163]|uniref:Histidine phosphatase superfamily (Branch 1) n=1 Tax=Rohdeia mirabilis TaxID=2528008 RepID=A0A518CWB5_9BACT|nr:Histidine phosphatase superfamily (branch 1) [Planctomycetes bacterium Pla163]
MNLALNRSTLALLIGTLCASVCSVAHVAPLGQEPTAPGAVAQEARESVEPVVVFLVRHAEKGDDDARDPGLSEAGSARAAELAGMLAGAGVTHLFASEYRRTQATLAPLAEVSGVEVEVVGARNAEALVARILELEQGSVAVVAGHSNTTPGLAAALSRASRTAGGRVLTDTLPEDEYGVLFEVVLPAPSERRRESATQPKLLELRYGE